MKKKIKPFKILSEKVLFETGPNFKIVETKLLTPTNDEVTWSYVRARQAVVIASLDKAKKILLKKEWRLGRRGFVWELPSGWVEHDNPTKKDILDAANRELQEEVGYKADKLRIIKSFYPYNHASVIFHLVLATDLMISKLEGDEHEHLEVRKLDFDKAYELVIEDQIPNAQTLSALLLLKDILKELNERQSS